MIWSLGFMEMPEHLLNDDTRDGFWLTSVAEKNLTTVLETFLRNEGLEYSYLDPRSPSHPASSKNLREGDQVWGWHKDDGGAPMNLLVWSNRTGTEILDPITRDVYQGRPNEVVVFDNLAMLHRTPEGRDPERWFIRGRIMTPLTNRFQRPPLKVGYTPRRDFSQFRASALDL